MSSDLVQSRKERTGSVLVEVASTAVDWKW